MKIRTYTDQLQREIQVPTSPKRIISLVPSQTELLFDLGLENEVVGITKFCIHPNKWFRSKPRIGGTKTINFDKIKALNPDLIIANKEENDEHQIKELMKLYPVWISDINNLDRAIEMIKSIGEITNRKDQSVILSDKIVNSFSTLKNLEKQQKKVLYLIWKNPYMSIGSSTFIHELLLACGLKNCLQNYPDNRYPELSTDEIKNLNPAVIFLSSEPYPFKEEHIAALQLICPKAKIRLVDGELFSWYGSRLLQSPNYFKEILKTI